MRAFVVGRFQPFHNGHRALIAQALEECVNVVVGIGSSNAKPSLRNPFTAQERRKMIEAAFPTQTAAGQLTLVDLPDLHDPPRWAREALRLASPVDKVYSNDEATLDLFETLRIPTANPGLVERDRFEAAVLRAQMAEDDPAWRKAVPPAVAKLLESLGAVKRLRAMEAVV